MAGRCPCFALSSLCVCVKKNSNCFETLRMSDGFCFLFDDSRHSAVRAPEVPVRVTPALFPLRLESLDVLRCSDLCTTDFVELTLPCSSAFSLTYTRPPYVESLQQRAGEAHACDIVVGSYLGGLKVWSCAVDLCCYVYEHFSELQFSNRAPRVVELGCGQGLPGLLTLLLGAQHVTFHDFNDDVLRLCTRPNVIHNLQIGCCEAGQERSAATASFCSGTWDTFFPAEPNSEGSLSPFAYDIVLASDATYSVECCEQLVACVQRVLAPGGVAFVATKKYYFGTGGGELELNNALERSNGNGGDLVVASRTVVADTGMSMARCVICLRRVPKP